jgi:hypothetical protein
MVLKLEVAGTCMCVHIVTLSGSCYCGPHLQLVCKSVLLHIAPLVCFLLAAGTQNFLKLVLLCVLPFAACKILQNLLPCCLAAHACQLLW